MNAQDCKKNQVNKILKVNAWGPYLPKAYNDTTKSADEYHPLKHHPAPSDNVVGKNGCV